MFQIGTSLTKYLSKRSRATGALFACCALLAQVGPALAANGGGTTGP